MDKTGIQVGAPTAVSDTPSTAVQAGPALLPAILPTAPAVRKKDHPLLRAVKVVADLRITVVLFLLSIILIFYGTWAQVDAGIWTVVHKYFRSFLVWIPLKVLCFNQVDVSGSLPYPGGWLLGSVMLVNLLAAHAVRFRISWKRSGILLIHAGLIVMMISELITGVYAIEGNITMGQGETANFVEHFGKPELAVIDSSDPDSDRVTVIPERMLRTGEVIRDERLPFDVEIVRYMVNSAQPVPAKQGAENPANAGDGKNLVAVARPEVSGTDPEQKVDLASAYVTFKKKGTGESLGTYLVSLWFSSVADRPQMVTVDGKTYSVHLRFKRTYKPYSLHLINFRHDVFPGMPDKPKNFSSLVRLVDPTRGENREVLISMNAPLRYAGETFYQSSFLPGDRGTVLQVVRNPGWLMPYISCVMVGLGMLVHFGQNLVNFLGKNLGRVG